MQRRCPVLTVINTLSPRDHQVGFPTFDRLQGDITHQLRETATGIAIGLVLQFYRVVVLQFIKVLIIAAVLIIDRLRRVADDSLAIGVISIGVRVFLTSNKCIQVELQDVVPNKLCIVQLHFKVLVISVTDDTFFLSITDIGRISGILGTTADVQIMIVLEACLTADGLQPICIIAEIFLSGLTINDIMSIHEISCLCPLGECDVPIVRNRCWCVAFASLGGDDNYTIGTTRTIDSCCRSIFQYVDRGDILRGYRCQITFNTVNEDQRGKAAHQCGDTTQTDGRGGTGVTAGVDDCQTGNLTFHEFCGVADLTCVEVLCLHRGHSRGDITLALGAVTDDDNLVQQGIVFLEGHIITCLDLLGCKTDVRDNERCIAVSNVQRVVTIVVGDGCILGALFSHGGSDNRLALRILNDTLHCDALLCDSSHVSRYVPCGIGSHPTRSQQKQT